MIFEIKEDKLKQLVFQHLDNSKLSNVDESEPWADGGIPFYSWEREEEVENMWEDPEIAFVYYEHPEYYEFSNTYEDDKFPLIEILEPFCSDVIRMLNEDIIFKYAPEWFEKELRRKVKSVSCG